MIASSHRSRHPATGCTGEVCGSGRVLVLPVTPEITASFVAAAEAAPAKRRRVDLRPFLDEQAVPGVGSERRFTPVERPRVDSRQ
jgi:hypothetical protein